MAQSWTERFSQPDVAPAGIMTAWFNDLRLSDSDVKKARKWVVISAVLHAVLHEPRSIRQILYVGGGEDTIEQALAKALGAGLTSASAKA